MRKLGRALGIVLVAAASLFLLAVALLGFLLGSTAGMRALLAMVPSEVGLSIAEAEGSLAVGFRLERVALATAGIQAQTLSGRLSWTSLLRGELVFAELRLEGIEIESVPTASPAAEASAGSLWPFPLPEPALSSPIPIRLMQLEADGRLGERSFAIEGGLGLDAEGFFFKRLRLRLEALTLELRGRIGGPRFRADVSFALAADALPEPVTGRIAGDFAEAGLQATIPLGTPLALSLVAKGLDREAPAFELRAAGEGLRLNGILPEALGETLDLELEASLLGRAFTVAFHAKAEAGALAWRAQGLLEESGVTLSALTAEASPWLALEGAGEFAWGGALRFAAELGLNAPEPLAAVLRGGLRLDGSLAALGFGFAGTLEAAGERSALELAGQASQEGIELSEFRLRHPDGETRLQGALRFAPEASVSLAGRLAGLRLGALGLPWAGELSADLRLHGALQAAGPALSLRIEGLRGRIFDQPLAGESRVDWRAGVGALKLELSLGEGRLRAALESDGEDIAGSVELHRLSLPPMLEAFEGEARIEGALAAPHWRLALRLERAELKPLLLRDLALKAWGRGLEPGEALTSAAEVALAGRSLGRLRAELSSGEGMRLALDLQGDQGRFEAELVAFARAGDWQGRIERVAIALEPLSLSLVEPVAFRVRSGTLALLEVLCLSGQGRLCVQAEQREQGLVADLSVEALPLEALTARLGAPWEGLAGLLRAELQYAPGPSATLSLQVSPTAWPGEGPVPLEAIRIEAALQGEALRAEALLEPGGHLELVAHRRGGQWLGEASGALELAPFEPWLAGVSGLSGRIIADWRSEGTTPLGELRLSLQDLRAELTALGSVLEVPSLRLSGDGEALSVAGQGRIGEGDFTLEGTLDAAAQRLKLRLRGERLWLLDRPDLRLALSPELELALSPEEGRIGGRVAIPEGRIDFSRLEAAEPRSRDVVIAGEAERQTWPVHADLLLEVGPELRLQGFGLDGRLRGVLALRERPGQPTAAFGALESEGRFNAYGATLEIRRGRLIFAGPMDAPLIDVRAERAIENGPTVALEARGDALAPEVRLASEPALPDEDILAYLIAGRPLTQLRSGEGASLAQAATALGTLGGDLLARRLGERLGLELAFAQDQGGAATLTAGRQLSPRLFLGYGFALDGSGGQLILRYLLARRWRAEVESGAALRARLKFEGERRAP
jgi:translocation and assembly module TamB